MSFRKKGESIPCTVSHNIERPPPSNLGVHTHNGNASCRCKKCQDQNRLNAGIGRIAVGSNHVGGVHPAAKNSSRYSKPQLNTALRLQNGMMLVQSLQPVPLTQDAQLTPRSKAIIAPKLTQKMNFRPETTVFKNLVPLNVNDSIILPRHLKAKRRRVAEPQSITNDEPELGDFVEELDKLEYVIPEADLDLQLTNEKFDYLQSYKNLYDLKVFQF